MSKKRVRLKPHEATNLGFTVKQGDGQRNPKYLLTEHQYDQLMKLRGIPEVSVGSESKTSPNDYQNKKGDKVIMSSWDFENNRNMGIEEYCRKYNLPYEHISSWKSVTHQNTPYYHTVFKTVSEIIEENLTEPFIESCIVKHVKPYLGHEPSKQIIGTFDEINIDRLIYSDVHIGLDPNGERNVALYPRDWKKEQIMDTLKEVCAAVLNRQTGPVLLIDELGDFMDGWDGKTTRKGHDLPQCMTNEEAFDVGLEFKIRMIQTLAPHYDTIICNNVCEDNHAGAFGYVVNKAFKRFIELQYPDKVTVFNRREFITHYQFAEHVFVLCHGKDASHLKFGFKPNLDPKQAEKIDQYLKHKGVYKLGGRIEFSKGDSHQLLFDMASSDDFEYMNYPALSPSSDWVQVNFKKGRRGFVLQHLNGETDDKVITPIFLK